jgi:hypothetical protein
MTAHWRGTYREAFELHQAAGRHCGCPAHREQEERRALDGLLTALDGRRYGRLRHGAWR